MATVRFEIITLDWKKTNYIDFPMDFGIYQIYGTSPLYDIDTLLYIGQAQNLNSRIKKHIEFKGGLFGRQADLSYRYAIAPKEKLHIIEKTLILMYKPIFNLMRIESEAATFKKKAYYIQNNEKRGLLNQEKLLFFES